jgi:hypothetical protein
MKPKMIFLSAILLALALLGSSCSLVNKGHTPSADEILGEWQTVSGSDASDYYFTAGDDGNYYFCTSLTGRPYESGSYTINNGKLLMFANQNNTYECSALLIRGDILRFTQDGMPVILRGSDRSRRCNPIFRLLRKRSGLNFSGPVTHDFTWLLPGGNQAEVNGFEMTASLTVEGDFTAANQILKKIGAGLGKLGFSADQANVTEVMNGYRRWEVVCQLFIQEVPNDQALICVRCGLLR